MVLITFADQVVCQGLADDTAQAFKEFCNKLVVPAFNHVGWETWRQRVSRRPGSAGAVGTAVQSSA